jgi:hypothetical protein
MTDLLPADSLRGVRVGISASESPDLPRLGLSESHFRLALAEIARRVLVAGGTLAYGGHLDPDGYTTFLLEEIQRYGARKDRPLTVFLAWSEHRRMALSKLREYRRLYGLYVSLHCLDPKGDAIEPGTGRGEDPVPEGDPQVVRAALTAMRHRMREETQGRVVLGGRRAVFLGEIPGVMEEVVVGLEGETPQPLYLSGGFGGITVDILRALRIDEVSWLPVLPNPAPEDPQLAEGRRRLEAIANGPDWRGLVNGLTPDETHRLAATHRPGEIADLVVLGLGRRSATNTAASAEK